MLLDTTENMISLKIDSILFKVPHKYYLVNSHYSLQHQLTYQDGPCITVVINA